MLIALTVASAAAQGAIIIDFDEDTVGTSPEGFFFAAARQASPGDWKVAGAARRHLIHFADPSVTLRGIAVAGVTAAAPADVRVSTRLRLIDGDRAGGVFWRYRDANNFYFMAITHTDRAARIFRVTGGNRILLDAQADINVDPDEWHTVVVIHEGDQIRATIDGIGINRARDAVLTEGGRAGVWSAGNSTSWFDDIAIDHAPQ